jgi:NADH-quinone oxidoreductase subunit H
METLAAQLLIAAVKAFIVVNSVLLAAAGLVYVERRVAAWIQDRIGPNRVGPFGLLQPFADVIKLYFKEDLVPALADRTFHRLAPLISIAVALSLYAVIPIADYILIAGERVYLSVAPHINVGLLYVLAMTSIGVYGIVLAGWSSNNKYSLLGGLRSSAQMISYELTLGLSVVGVVMVQGRWTCTRLSSASSRCGTSSTSPWAFCCSWWPPLPRPTARRSTCRKPSRSSSAATTRSIRA